MAMRGGLVALVAVAALAAACNSAEPCPSRVLTSCGGQCVDTRADVGNCGACGKACATGLACVDSQCVESSPTACTARTGGAFVTLGVCGSAVKIWTTGAAFADAADAALADPATPARYPVFDLRSGTDCDAQWSWHVDPSTAAFGTAAPSGCDACPAAVEAAPSFWVSDVKQWCPVDVRVLAVDRR